MSSTSEDLLAIQDALSAGDAESAVVMLALVPPEHRGDRYSDLAVRAFAAELEGCPQRAEELRDAMATAGVDAANPLLDKAWLTTARRAPMALGLTGPDAALGMLLAIPPQRRPYLGEAYLQAARQLLPSLGSGCADLAEALGLPSEAKQASPTATTTAATARTTTAPGTVTWAFPPDGDSTTHDRLWQRYPAEWVAIV
ncbi:unnamed protein product, partial [Polarella glacialis]